MTTQQTTSTPAIARDVPCVTCGYNLRGLSPSSLCPECGTVIAESLERASGRGGPNTVWARMVLLGLFLWLAVTPLFITHLLNLAGLVIFGAPYGLNYPGPKAWAVPAFARGNPTGMSVAGVHAYTLICALAIYLITSPRHGGESGAAFYLRIVARWAPCLLLCSVFAIATVNPWLSNVHPYAIRWMIGLVIFVECPCTVVLYAYLADLAARVGLGSVGRMLLLLAGAVGVLVIAPVLPLLVIDPPEFYTDTFAMVLASGYQAVASIIALVAAGLIIRIMVALVPEAWPTRA